MSSQDVRAGIQQAKVGDTGMGFLALETIILAIGLGVWKESLAVGIITFIGMMFLIVIVAQFRVLGEILAGVIGLAWGLAAAFIATALGASQAAALAAAAFAFLLGSSAHSAGFRTVRDVQAARG